VAPTWITRRVLSEGVEEREERSKEEISHLQEVTGPDVHCVVVQERRPLLSSWSWCVNMWHVLLDGALAHLHAEFQQFSTNPLSTEDGDSSLPSP
jgi:hypothetical protein